MATTTAALSPVTMAVATVTSPKRRVNVNYITGLSSFGGLKAQNNISTLGLPVSTEQSFAKVVSSLREPRNKSGGGAMSSTCSAIAEIFRIHAWSCSCWCCGWFCSPSN